MTRTAFGPLALRYTCSFIFLKRVRLILSIKSAHSILCSDLMFRDSLLITPVDFHKDTRLMSAWIDAVASGHLALVVGHQLHAARRRRLAVGRAAGSGAGAGGGAGAGDGVHAAVGGAGALALGVEAVGLARHGGEAPRRPLRHLAQVGGAPDALGGGQSARHMVTFYSAGCIIFSFQRSSHLWKTMLFI